MNKKFWIRWVIIALICIAYYVIVLYFDLVFAVNFSEAVSQGWDFTPSQLTSFVMELSQNHSDSALASIVGFAVCVPLILLIFNRQRLESTSLSPSSIFDKGSHKAPLVVQATSGTK